MQFLTVKQYKYTSLLTQSAKLPAVLEIFTTLELKLYEQVQTNETRILEIRQMASILAVDDSASMRQMVSFTLKGAGYDVIEAVDGVDALNKAKTKTVDLVVTDVNMPNKDGITLIKDLRALPAYKFTPMLMLTTEAGGDKKQQGKAAGATGWIVKPFNPDQLLKTVKKVLG